MPALLQVTDLSAGYGPRPVLDRISLTVNELETVCVLGANGAGKTTLVSTIAGLLTPAHGRVEFAGDDVTGLMPDHRARRGLSLVRQGRSIFPHLTVEDNLALGGYLVRERTVRRERLEAVFGMFPVLRQRRRQLAGSMSGGEQKMLEIGRALMLSLKLLILDEPSLGLAPVLVDAIFERIREFNRQGMAVLVVEQNVGAALGVAHRGYVLELGRVVLAASSAELLQNDAVRASYLGQG
jgi:branched-chain amino acid transport system ATP-binding protein